MLLEYPWNIQRSEGKGRGKVLSTVLLQKTLVGGKTREKGRGVERKKGNRSVSPSAPKVVTS